MNIQINLKGISNRKNKIKQMVYEYPDQDMTLREFLTETVRINVRAYHDMGTAKVRGSKDYYDRSEDSLEIVKCLTGAEMEDQAASGKVSFGILYGETMADEQKAIDNALTCFQDGMVAVFVGDQRYEDLEMKMELKEGCTVTFIRLTFLVGRMW